VRPKSLLHQAIDGSYICADYELRVTRRCCADDLGCAGADPFQYRASHEIVLAFINRRKDSPINTREVTPLSTGRTVYRLAYGDRHRGATWHDDAHNVVWLLAYAQHEFEGTGDAFPYFKALDAKDRLLPDTADYEDLFHAQADRLAHAVPAECIAVLEHGRAALGTEVSDDIAGQVHLACCVEKTDGLEEVTIAIKYRGLTTDNLPIVLASFFPDATPDELEIAGDIAGRQLGADEVAYRWISDAG
jgi:hypothetical protein